ncbi:MAG: hypothetical protein EA398_18015 [Deltaproteobacteria bacterium]|nr:MAG: hypothetical protein EA398_18015 [Deltaproteobacteria bacterium]
MTNVTAPRPGFWRLLLLLLRKDITVELRTREVLHTAGLFALVLMTLFSFAGFADRELAATTAPGVLWVAIAFLGALVFTRTFQRERENRAMDGLLLVPGILDALYTSKLLTNLLLLLTLQALLVPTLLLVFPLPVQPPILPLVALLLAGTLGLCALGTVLSAALAAVRMREVLLPLLLYPLAIPLLIAGVKGSATLFDPLAHAGHGDWLSLMIAFDALFLVLGRWLFGEAVDA